MRDSEVDLLQFLSEIVSRDEYFSLLSYQYHASPIWLSWCYPADSRP